MASTVDDSTDAQKKRKPRPSRGRGLRTTTGCLTCRRRRLKCDEAKPACGQCLKSGRDCLYGTDAASNTSPTISKRGSWGTQDVIPLPQSTQISPDESVFSRFSSISDTPVSGAVDAISLHDLAQDLPHRRSVTYTGDYVPNTVSAGQRAIQPLQPEAPHAPRPQQSSQEPQSLTNQKTSPTDAFSPVTQSTSITPGQAPYEWWEQIAQDAAKDNSSYQALKDSHSRWSFEPVDLSRSSAPSPAFHLHSNGRQSGHDNVASINRSTYSWGSNIGSNYESVAKEPWNTSEPPNLSARELEYLKYYINIIGPIFDLFDPARSFTHEIPHLAMRNVGLLKSVLAVAARFKSLHASRTPEEGQMEAEIERLNSFTDDDDAISTELYFETLSYLSQAMQYPSYTRSKEILATAALISSYEYFHVNRSADWERHLKGVFWIQRSQETNGEREGLPGAVWWNWLRQDIWAALWQGRKPLTIWEPTKHVTSLRGQEFASRATFLLARAVKYANARESKDATDIPQRIAEGDKLFQDLQDWYSLLPTTYRPLPATTVDSTDATAMFPPVWIHPEFHAAAMQNYFTARILVLLNRPSSGGVDAYRDTKKLLQEAISMICGLAQSPTAWEYASSMAHCQALYVAGQCVSESAQQQALYEILERILVTNKFPAKSLLIDLRNRWSDNT